MMTPAERTGTGRRRYSDEDVERFTLLKWLTDHGEAIGAVATLDLPGLHARQERHLEAERSQQSTFGSESLSNRVVRLGFIGDRLMARFRHLSPSFQVLYTASELSEELEEPLSKQALDVLVLDLRGVREDIEPLVRVLRKAQPQLPITCLYDFAPRRILDGLVALDLHLVRWPVSRIVFERLLAEIALGGSRFSLYGREDNDEATPSMHALLSESQLAAISEVTPSLPCECPLHVTSLIYSLRDFEDYCRRCVNVTTEDAQIHQHLGLETARARSIMEQALIQLCEHDNIVIPPKLDHEC